MGTHGGFDEFERKGGCREKAFAAGTKLPWEKRDFLLFGHAQKPMIEL